MENIKDLLKEKSKIYRQNNKEKIKLNHEKRSNIKYGMTEEKIKKIEELWEVNFPKMKETYLKYGRGELVYKKNLTPRLKEFYMEGYGLINKVKKV